MKCFCWHGPAHVGLAHVGPAHVGPAHVGPAGCHEHSSHEIAAPEVKQPVLGAKRVQMVCDLLQLRFLALLYFKQKSVFLPSVRQKANPAVSYWAAVGSS